MPYPTTTPVVTPPPSKPTVTITDVERLTLRSSDVLVLHVPKDTKPSDCDLMRRHLEIRFPNNKILVLAGDATLKIYSSGGSSNVPREPEWATEATIAKAKANPIKWSA